MKRCLVVLLTVLLVGAAMASQAAGITFTVESLTRATPDWTFPGEVNTSSFSFYALLSPSAQHQTLTEPSVVAFGLTSTVNVAPALDPDTFGATPATGQLAPFRFGIYPGLWVNDGDVNVLPAGAHTIDVFGYVSGDVQLQPEPRSGARWTIDHVVDYDDPLAVFSVSANPVTGEGAILEETTINGLPFRIWYNAIRDLPAPGQTQLAYSGYVALVPEPGAMALLIGSGVSASLFLRRRRSR